MRMGHRKLQPPPCLGRASSAGCAPRSAPAALCCHSTGQTAYLQRHTCQRTLLSTSSSGQDVALWPRQPRFKSWCGQSKLHNRTIRPLICYGCRSAVGLGPLHVTAFVASGWQYCSLPGSCAQRRSWVAATSSSQCATSCNHGATWPHPSGF